MKKELQIPAFTVVKILPGNYGNSKYIYAAAELIHNAAEIKEAAGPDSLKIFPGGKTVKVKSFSKDGKKSRQYIIGIKGISAKSVFPGALLVYPEWPVNEETTVLLLPEGKGLKKENVKISGGLFFKTSVPAQISTLYSYIKLKFSRPYPVFPGELLEIYGAAGSVRRFYVVWPGVPDSLSGRKLEESLKRRPGPVSDPAEIYRRILYIKKYVLIPPSLIMQNWPDTSVLLNQWVVLQKTADFLEKKILKAVSIPGGADIDKIKSVPALKDYPSGLLNAAAFKMSEEGRLKTVRQGKKMWYLPQGKSPLSPFHRKLLEKIENSGLEGIRVSSAVSEAETKAMEELKRTLYIYGGTYYWFSEKAVNAFTEKIHNKYSSGDQFSLTEAKNLFGGSRPYVLEILSILNENKVISENNRIRIVL